MRGRIIKGVMYLHLSCAFGDAGGVQHARYLVYDNGRRIASRIPPGRDGGEDRRGIEGKRGKSVTHLLRNGCQMGPQRPKHLPNRGPGGLQNEKKRASGPRLVKRGVSLNGWSPFGGVLGGLFGVVLRLFLSCFFEALLYHFC